jgi:hypothetical protein
MKRRALPISLGLLLAAASCGPAEVVVSVEIEVENPDGEGTVIRPLPNVEVQLLPYDRDFVFDSIEAASPTPEPPIPQALLTARQNVADSQQRWQASERRWNNLRDTLQKITATMQRYSRGEARYLALFQDFQRFDGQLASVEAETKAAFAEFSSLRRTTLRQSDSVRTLREAWGDEAFRHADEAFLAKLRASGLGVAVDTTDPSGVAQANLRVEPGMYWVHARYELPYTELYWNVPVDVQRGDPVRVHLTRENAEERIKL